MSDLPPTLILFVASLVALVMGLATRSALMKISNSTRQITAALRAQESAARINSSEITNLRGEITSLKAQGQEALSTSLAAVSNTSSARLLETVDLLTAPITFRLEELGEALQAFEGQVELIANSQNREAARLDAIAARLETLLTRLDEMRTESRKHTNASAQATVPPPERDPDMLGSYATPTNGEAAPDITAATQLVEPATHIDPAEALGSAGQIEESRLGGTSPPTTLEPGPSLAGPDDQAPSTKSYVRPPVQRGGRPRGITASPEAPVRPRPTPPEVTCRKRVGSWTLAVQIPEAMSSESGIQVLQTGYPLTQDDRDEDLWPLTSITAPITIRASSTDEIKLGNSELLIFKLGATGVEGRHVRSLGSGLSLVVVPNHWLWDTRSDYQPVAVEPTTLPGLRAFLLDLDNVTSPARWVTTDGRTAATLPVRGLRFRLVGHELNDSTPRIGPLFGSAPPMIETALPDGWRDVSLIVIGAEGSGEGRWRTQYTPDPDSVSQDISHALPTHNTAWYFLRFYDRQHHLIDSLDFRFLAGLTDICHGETSQPSGPDGHAPVALRFVHDNTCTVTSTAAVRRLALQCLRTPEGSIAHVPADPAWDISTWQISNTSGAMVQLTVHLPRLWWSFGDEASPGTKWGVTCLSSSLHDFSAGSARFLWLRGLTPSATRPSLVRLQPGQTVRELTFRGELAYIALRDLCDAPELQQPGEICLQLSTTPSQDPACELARLMIQARCRWCNDSFTASAHLVEHASRSHLDEAFPRLTYEETHALLRESMPSLPSAIYRCSHCPFHSKENDPSNITSVICNHIEQKHRGLPLQFRVIRDLQEVRANVIPSLPDARRCFLCGQNFTSATSGALADHLRQDHPDGLGSLA